MKTRLSSPPSAAASAPTHRLLAKDRDRERRARVVFASFEKHLHVGSRAGEREQSRFVIDEAFERSRVVTAMLEEVNDEPGIEIARARAHDEPGGWRERHRRVDRLPVTNSRHARAASEMRDDRATELVRAQSLDDVLVRQPVKTVSPNACVEERSGECEPLRDLGERSMKRCVEADDLRHVGEARAHGFDRAELRRKMERRERDRERE